MKVDVLMIGTGEYTTGFVNGKAADSDKGAGVVGLTMFDLRRRGIVGRVGLVGTNGNKFPGIRAHMQAAIADVYAGISVDCDTFPRGGVVDPRAYLEAIKTFSPGSCVTIFTPDDTHFEIALACINHGLHVLVTKPAVKTLEHHQMLYDAAVAKNVVVAVEVHKRLDQMYTDARDRIQKLGPFSYMYAYMSQPKHQLETFKSWAGKSSDISYYLNSHHVDFHEWAIGHSSKPISVIASAAKGVATEVLGTECEDSITLLVQWQNLDKSKNDIPGNVGTAVYTSSWVAPKSDVHSQQRFFYQGQKGEINIDQAHRGYCMSSDDGGYASVNPLFMKYTPCDGKFVGQLGYGYRSFEQFIDAAIAVNLGEKKASDFNYSLASLHTTFGTTAILEAGRRSLDAGGKSVKILYENASDQCRPTGFAVE